MKTIYTSVWLLRCCRRAFCFLRVTSDRRANSKQAAVFLSTRSWVNIMIVLVGWRLRAARITAPLSFQPVSCSDRKVSAIQHLQLLVEMMSVFLLRQVGITDRISLRKTTLAVSDSPPIHLLDTALLWLQNADHWLVWVAYCFQHFTPSMMKRHWALNTYERHATLRQA
jgi:hypothetical protein